jgi:hypothetical protein
MASVAEDGVDAPEIFGREPRRRGSSATLVVDKSALRRRWPKFNVRHSLRTTICLRLIAKGQFR